MGKRNLISEGSLRGREGANGKWEFSFVSRFDQEVFPLVASSVYEARQFASQMEHEEFRQYCSERRKVRAATNSTRTGWTGSILTSETSDFLIDEFDLDTAALTESQRLQLQMDALSLDGTRLSDRRDTAKADLKTIQRAAQSLLKLVPSVEGVRPPVGVGVGAGIAPDESLAKLILNFADLENGLEQQLDELGRRKENLTSLQLCENAIDVFLRWGGSHSDPNQQGLVYASNFDDLKRLPKLEGDLDEDRPSRLGGPLGEFLEKTQKSLHSQGLDIWSFNVHEPARKALARHSKRQ